MANDDTMGGLKALLFLCPFEKYYILCKEKKYA